MLWCGAFIGIRSNRLQLFWSIPFNRQNFPLIVRWLCSFFLSVLKTDIFVLLWILTNFSLQEKNSCKAAFWANYSCASKPQWRTPVLPVCELLLLLILEKFQPIAEGKEKKEKKKIRKLLELVFWSWWGKARENAFVTVTLDDFLLSSEVIILFVLHCWSVYGVR